VLVGLAVVPLVVLLARAGFQEWNPVCDVATMAVRAGEVGTSHTPLVGPYSRFDWSHPGPLLYYLLAIPYRAFGNHGLLVGSLAINGVAVVVFVRTLLRVGGAAAATLAVTLVGIATFSLGTWSLWSPWNPTIALLPFAAFIAVTWSVSLGQLRDAPWLVGLGSLLVQSHVGYGLLVLGLVLVAALGAWSSRRPRVPKDAADTPAEDPRRPMIISGIVIVILWIPVAIDALTHRGGNVADLFEFWTSGAPTIGALRALRLMALALSLRAPWLGFDAPSGLQGDEVHGWPVPIALVLLLIAFAVAVRGRDRIARNLCVVVLATIVVGSVAVSSIIGDPLFYLVHWTKIVAAMTWFASTWTLARALPAHVRTRARRFAWPALIVGSFAVLAMLTVSSARADVPDGVISRALGTVLPQVRRELAEAPGPVAVDTSDGFWSGCYGSGLLLTLLQSGVDVTATRGEAKYFGTHYANDRAPGTSVSVVTSALGIERGKEQGGDLIAQSAPIQPLPRDAAPQLPGEDITSYLARLADTDPQALKRLEPWWLAPFPVAVFRGSVPP